MERELRNKGLKEILETYQRKYDQVVDQMAILRGTKDRIEKFIQEVSKQMELIDMQEKEDGQ